MKYAKQVFFMMITLGAGLAAGSGYFLSDAVTYPIFQAGKDTLYTEFSKKNTKGPNFDNMPILGAVFSIGYALQTGCYAITYLFLATCKSQCCLDAIPPLEKGVTQNIELEDGTRISIQYPNKTKISQDHTSSALKALHIAHTANRGYLGRKTTLLFPVSSRNWDKNGTGFSGDSLTAIAIRALSHKEKAKLYGTLCASNIANILTLGFLHFAIAQKIILIYQLNGGVEHSSQI